MQQQTRRLAFLVGAALLTGISVLVACSDDAVQPLPGGSTSGGLADSGHVVSTTSGGPNGDDDDNTGEGGSKDAGGADCSAAPTLHSTSAGFYCAFFRDAGPDSGGASNCANDETCCVPGKLPSGTYGLSFCAQTDTKDDNGQDTCSNNAQAYAGQDWAAAGSTTWECGGSSNCGGRKCCGFSDPAADAGNLINIGNDVGTGAPPAACKAQYIYKIAGTKCADDCAAKELELCSSTDACSDTSAKCTAAGTTGSRDLGVCVTH